MYLFKLFSCEQCDVIECYQVKKKSTAPGGPLAQLVECTSHVQRLYPQQMATVQSNLWPFAASHPISRHLSELSDNVRNTTTYTSITAVPSHGQDGIKGQPDLPPSGLRLCLHNCSQPTKTCCDTQLASVQEIRVSQSLTEYLQFVF